MLKNAKCTKHQRFFLFFLCDFLSEPFFRYVYTGTISVSVLSSKILKKLENSAKLLKMEHLEMWCSEQKNSQNVKNVQVSHHQQQSHLQLPLKPNLVQLNSWNSHKTLLGNVSVNPSLSSSLKTIFEKQKIVILK